MDIGVELLYQVYVGERAELRRKYVLKITFVSRRIKLSNVWSRMMSRVCISSGSSRVPDSQAYLHG